MSTPEDRRVLLVTMPWATPVHPSLALGLLSAILQRDGVAADCLYGNLLLPRNRGESVYTITDPGQYEDRSAGLAFVPLLHPDVRAEDIAETVADRHLDIVSREGQLPIDPLSLEQGQGARSRDALVSQALEDIERGTVCLERCLEVIAAGPYDVIGFSITFETQLIASLALARQVKERWPERKVMLGGAACFSVQGRAIIETFPFVDAVCTGEGDAAVTPLVRALRGDAPVDAAPGVLLREGDQLRMTARGEPFDDLDALPTPDYDSYVTQKARSDWRDTIDVLLFETSRGCWWGEKHLCTFCGLNGETIGYRSKSPGRVLQELGEIQQRWDTSDGLQAVDNIFDSAYFTTLLPDLARQQRRDPVALFFEIKSNVRLPHLFQLADAGVLTLQPGIEAFDDHILELMDKGAKAIQQVNFIKWAHQIGIAVTYNLLLRNPGETVADYERMLELVPFISHLPPPNGIANMQLERYSPYFLDPARFGMYNVRPKAHYRTMFPDGPRLLDDIVYQFDFDHDLLDQPELVAVRRRFIRAVLGWKRRYEQGTLRYWLDDGGDVVVVDRRSGSAEVERLSGLRGEIFLGCDDGPTFAKLAARFPAVAPEAVRAFLDELVLRRLAYHQAGPDRYVLVAVRAYRDRDEYERDRDRNLRSLARVQRIPVRSG